MPVPQYSYSSTPVPLCQYPGNYMSVPQYLYASTLVLLCQYRGTGMEVFRLYQQNYVTLMTRIFFPVSVRNINLEEFQNLPNGNWTRLLSHTYLCWYRQKTSMPIPRYLHRVFPSISKSTNAQKHITQIPLTLNQSQHKRLTPPHGDTQPIHS